MNPESGLTLNGGIMTYIDRSGTVRNAARIDEKLIAKIAKDDDEALHMLYEQASAAVFAYAFSVLKNRDDAMDVMQDTFLKIRAAAHLYEPHGKPAAWIFTIARNLCNMRFRENSRMADTPADELGYLHDLSQLKDPELKITLEMCFQKLDDTERQVIILHAMSGMKHRETASLLKMPLATVLSKYHRGLKKLRAQLEGIQDES